MHMLDDYHTMGHRQPMALVLGKQGGKGFSFTEGRQGRRIEIP